MAAQQNLSNLYSDLNKSINKSDYRQALKAANKILHTKEGNGDVDTMHCKVVAMLQMNQFSETLKFIEATEQINNVLIFEKAYCQYRLLLSEEALATINQTREHDIRLNELKAQVLYKLGRYEEALTVYKRLIKDCSDDYDEERKTNLSAVHAALSAFHGVETNIGFVPDSYEQLYNKACWLIGRGKVEEAKDLLEQAEASCRQLYEGDPDITAEDIEAETSVIRVQLGYCLQILGNEDKALAIYNQVIRSRPSDLAMVAVASNNIISINKEQNVFDSKKKMKATIASGVENKLVPFQRQIIDFNRALLFMYSNQWDACRKLLKGLQREHRSSSVPSLIQAMQLCREKNASKAIDYLKNFISEHSDPDLSSDDLDLKNIKLALVQLLLSQGQLAESCSVLESMPEISYEPAVVSCLVNLYRAQGKEPEMTSKLFTRAVEWHKKKKSSLGLLFDLMWQSSKFNLDHNKPQEGASVLEDMLRLDPKNVKVLAKLIYAYSQFNTSKAHQISKGLPSLAELSVHVNVDELERGASRLAPRYVKKLKEKKETVAMETTVKKDVVSEGSLIPDPKKVKKKKKKNPVPKNFEPNFTPDPERWFPLRERSYYKGKRKDRKRGVGKGTQGSHVTLSDTYDMSQKIGPSPSQAAPNSPKPGSVSGSQGNTPVNSPKPTQVRGGAKAKKPVNKKKKKGKGGW
ncbi:unnamed protein product [Clavelina lepadiformis]|uniref:Signal recognition particle subunit SRP72 n=1 Tax=Clavelina lepadiformis TaxID=159417 RepID=A0ABP0G8D3_CLALP